MIVITIIPIVEGNFMKRAFIYAKSVAAIIRMDKEYNISMNVGLEEGIASPGGKGGIASFTPFII
jgi:hypothetical protein